MSQGQRAAGCWLSDQQVFRFLMWRDPWRCQNEAGKSIDTVFVSVTSFRPLEWEGCQLESWASLLCFHFACGVWLLFCFVLNRIFCPCCLEDKFRQILAWVCKAAPRRAEAGGFPFFLEPGEAFSFLSSLSLSGFSVLSLLCSLDSGTLTGHPVSSFPA